MDNELRKAVEKYKDYPEESSIKVLVNCCERVLDAEESIDLEKMAEIEHTRWSGWQEYLHSKCIKNEDGSLTIPSGYVENLVRLINTPYDKLTEKEKESDRAEAKNSIDQAAIVIAKNYRRVDELRWAENLILQLPKSHDGRNSWLGNYGISDEAKAIHKEMIGGSNE